jgi:hypothetical protein
MADNSEKIKKLEDELAQAKKEQVEFNALTEEQRLAEIIHSKMCHWNHTDGCGWFYDKWSDNRHNGYRVEYLNKAIAILKQVNFETAKLVVNNL